MKDLHELSITAVRLEGTCGIATRIYEVDEIRKVIHLQACARRFLAMRMIKNILENPS